jgi:F0F1-type ATP synthase assembly protein I
MGKYNNNFEFTVSNNSETKEKLKSYFKSYDFEQVKDEKENLLFVKKWSILNGWKFNPLNWETKINIKLTENNKVIINHIVHSNGFLTPIAFKSLFEKFLSNLEQFVEFNEKHKTKNIQEIKLAKEKVYKYHGILILGILIGLFLGIIMTNITGIKLLGTVGIIVGAITTEKIMNKYLIKNNNPQHLV